MSDSPTDTAWMAGHDATWVLERAESIAGFGSWTHSIRDDRSTWSRQMFRLLGQDPEAFVPTTEAFLSLLDPEARTMIEGYVADLLAGGLPAPVEYRFVRPEGDEVFLRVVAELEVNPAGEPLFLVGTTQDVTALRESERRHRQTGDALRAALHASQVGLWSWDVRRDLVRYSAEWKHQLGYRPEEVGDSFAEWEERVHPADLPGVLAAIERYLAAADAEADYEVEFRMRHRDGSWIWILARAKGEFGEDGTPIRMSGGHSVVTRSVEARQALHASEERLRLATELADVAVWEFDVRSGQMKRSANHDGLYNLPPQDQWVLETFVEATHVRDRERGQAIIAAAIAPGGNDRYHFDFQLSATPKWLSVVGEVVERDATGTAVLVRGCLSDVTTRRLAEQRHQRLAAVVEQAGESIIVTDLTGKIVYVNAAYEREIGLARDEICGELMTLSPRDPERSDDQPWDTIRGGLTWRGDILMPHHDGSVGTVEASIFPVNDEAGEVVGFASVQRDVTAHRGVLEELYHAQKMESVGRLAAGVAHDFNNILSVIQGTSDLLLFDAPEGHPWREDLLRIRETTGRAAGLIRRMLAFSRRQPLRLEVVDLRTVVNELGGLVGKILGADIVYTASVSPGPMNVNADRAQLDQVLLNLLVNAKDAMPAGGTVVLTVRPTEEAMGRWVRVTIEDSGVGMSDEVRVRACEPFFTTKPVGKGTGLGLSTAERIITEGGGRFSITSAPNQGTTIELLLPWSPAVVDTPPAPGPALAVSGRGTILLVDDEPALRGVVQKMLHTLGYQVLAATDGQDALSRLASSDTSVTLVLADLLMPVMGGRELAALLAERHPDLQVMIMSASLAGEHAPVQGPNVSPVILHKPFGVRELAGALTAVLERPVVGGTGPNDRTS